MVIDIIEIIIGIMVAKYALQAIDLYGPKARNNTTAFFKRRRNVKVNNKRLERMILNAKRRSANEEGKR